MPNNRYSIVGFENDNLKCYRNSVVQCLLSCKMVRQQLIINCEYDEERGNIKGPSELDRFLFTIMVVAGKIGGTISLDSYIKSHGAYLQGVESQSTGPACAMEYFQGIHKNGDDVGICTDLFHMFSLHMVMSGERTSLENSITKQFEKSVIKIVSNKEPTPWKLCETVLNDNQVAVYHTGYGGDKHDVHEFATTVMITNPKMLCICVESPENLSVPTIMEMSVCKMTQSREKDKYELCALVMVHEANTPSGHYIACVKTEKNQWNMVVRLLSAVCICIVLTLLYHWCF